MLRMFALFFLFCVSLLADDDSLSLVNLTQQPIPRVFGTVNVISGDWVDQEIHEQPTGIDSFPISHSYTSSGTEGGSIVGAWNFSWPSALAVYTREAMNESPYKHFAYLKEGGGATYMFSDKGIFGHFHIHLENTGYTHISSIDHPNLENLKRIRIRNNGSETTWYVHLPDGTTRTYAKTKRESYMETIPGYLLNTYHITKEVLPSKNIRLYSYNEKDRLVEIKTISSCKKHVIQKITLTKKWPHITAKSLEGKEVVFSLKNLFDDDICDFAVTAVSRPDAPKREYDYCDKSPRHHRRVEKRRWSTGRVEEAKFYTDSRDTIIDGEEIHQSSKKRDFTKSRVREIRTKRFRGEETFSRNRFYYSKEFGKFPHTWELSVSEPDDAYTKFKIDKQRIEALSYFDKGDKYLASQHFVWDTGSHEGRLLQRNIYDSERNPSLIKESVFDKHGFPTEEIYHGFLTGKQVPEIETHKNEYRKGGETWSEEATWDSKGNLLSRRDPDGNWTYFEYDRAFITRKVVCDKKHIIRREFARYDTAGNLIEHIQDDSHHTDKDNLEGATKRIILKIVPRLKAPHFGEPESKTESVWTPKDGLQLKKSEQFLRDEKGRLIRHIVKSYDGLQKEVSYAYDTLNRLIETVLPDGSKETLSYDPTTGLVQEKTFPNKKVTFSYDLLQRVISEKETFSDGSVLEKTYEYDTSGRIITTRDGRGRKEILEKDLLNRPVRKTLPHLPTDEGLVKPVVTYQYQGRWVIETSPTGAVKKTLFSSIGKPLEIIHPEGHTTTYRYDLLGREIEQFDGERRLKTTYDARGHVIKKETYADKKLVEWEEHTFQGDECLATETEFLRTTYTYDRFGRCIEKHILDKITNKEQVEQIEYDGFDRIIQRSTFAGKERFTYDTMDRVLTKQRISPQGTTLFHETTVHDQAGRVVQKSHLKDGLWLTTSTAYGTYGMPATIQATDGTTTRFFYRQEAGTFVKKTIDPLGITKEEFLAANDTPTKTIVYSPFGKKLAETRTTLTLLGKPHTIDYDVFYKDTLEETIRTVLEYDTLGRITSVKEAVGTNEEVSSQKAYDTYNRCIEETCPSGIRLTSTYDEKGRLIHKTSSDNTIDFSFSYTHHNLVKKAIDNILHKETARTYDGFGHLLSETQSNNLKTDYEYAGSLLTQFTLPDSSSISYTYDGDALLKAERHTQQTTYSFTIARRNTCGAILETTLPFSLGSVTYSYDTLGRPLSKTQPISSETRTYDLIGRPTSRTIDGTKETFQYDDLSQLISDNGKNRSYDSLYRMREKEGQTTTVTRRQQCTSLGSKTFAYDLDGHRTRDGSATLTYDALGRLTSYTKEGLTKTYEYDPFSRLMSTTLSGITERYLWMGQQEIGSFDNQGLCHSFLLLAEGVGSEGGGTFAVELEGIPYACLTDLSGNIRALLSSSGEIAHSATYSSFDRLTTEGLLCPWGFFSKRHDDFSHYVFFLYRLYDPETSSWITQDPLGLEAGPNLYAYVKNNPLTLFDRLGLFGESFCDACSSCFNSICDFVSDTFSSACDFVSDICSSVASSVSDFFSSSFTESAPPPTNSSPSLNTNDIPLKNGQVITPMTRAPRDGLYVYPYGTIGDFSAAVHQNPSILSRMSPDILSNGILNSLFECMQRCQKMEHEPDNSYSCFAFLYNRTKSPTEDIFETLCSIFHIETAVVRNLRQDLIQLCDLMIKYEDTRHLNLHPHSQGGANIACALSSPLFQEHGSYHNKIGAIFTYGAISFHWPGDNFVAWFDFVPWINPVNWITAIMHPECIHFTEFHVQSPLTAHGFDNPSYHEAFRNATKNR